MSEATLDAVAAHAGNEKKSPMAKLLAASAAAAQRRLRTASSKLNAVIPSHAVVFDKMMRGKGQAPARVVFRWPGVLVLLDPEGGETRGVPWEQRAVWAALERDDVLAAAFARLLLWTDACPLPALGDWAGGWDYYLRTWRPGKPKPDKWPGLYRQAVDAAGGAR
jgi:hypothetical protein